MELGAVEARVNRPPGGGRVAGRMVAILDILPPSPSAAPPPRRRAPPSARPRRAHQEPPRGRERGPEGRQPVSLDDYDCE